MTATHTQATKLTPIDCGKDDTAVLEAAFDGQRKRPVVAIDRQGHKVVCCLRTAKKNGWKIEGRLFNKPKKAESVKAEPVKAEPVDKPAAKVAAKVAAKKTPAKKTAKKDPLLG